MTYFITQISYNHSKYFLLTAYCLSTNFADSPNRQTGISKRILLNCSKWNAEIYFCTPVVWLSLYTESDIRKRVSKTWNKTVKIYKSNLYRSDDFKLEETEQPAGREYFEIYQRNGEPSLFLDPPSQRVQPIRQETTLISASAG